MAFNPTPIPGRVPVPTTPFLSTRELVTQQATVVAEQIATHVASDVATQVATQVASKLIEAQQQQLDDQIAKAVAKEVAATLVDPAIKIVKEHLEMLNAEVARQVQAEIAKRTFPRPKARLLRPRPQPPSAAVGSSVPQTPPGKRVRVALPPGFRGFRQAANDPAANQHSQ